ncbi:unnamed protein product [Effrenium voratum]|nr:unnamed protein product [Effrenium voratum]
MKRKEVPAVYMLQGVTRVNHHHELFDFAEGIFCENQTCCCCKEGPTAKSWMSPAHASAFCQPEPKMVEIWMTGKASINLFIGITPVHHGTVCAARDKGSHVETKAQ